MLWSPFWDTPLNILLLLWTWTWRNTTTSPYYDMRSILWTLIKKWWGPYGHGGPLCEPANYTWRNSPYYGHGVHTMNIDQKWWGPYYGHGGPLYEPANILDGIVHTMDIGSILWTLIKTNRVHTMDMGVHSMYLHSYYGHVFDWIVHTMD